MGFLRPLGRIKNNYPIGVQMEWNEIGSVFLFCTQKDQVFLKTQNNHSSGWRVDLYMYVV
jgi:hypothetical protein